MAMQLKPQKAKSKTKLGQNIVIIFLVVALILTVIVVNKVSSDALTKTVSVAVLTTDIPKDGAITADMFKKVEMHQVGFESMGIDPQTLTNKIVLWKDLGLLTNSATGVYAAVYIRAGRPLYWEDLSNKTTQKNSYLYNMDGELIKLDIVPSDFGDMVVPGDKLNVRITYTTDDYSLPSDAQFADLKEAGVSLNGKITVTETLFSEVSILDMLNKNGESIFDLYYELLSYPQAKRDAIINSSDFKSRVAPSNLLMAVTAEEAERYARIKNMKGSYLITLLPRDGTTEILNALDELKTGFARN